MGFKSQCAQFLLWHMAIFFNQKKNSKNRTKLFLLFKWKKRKKKPSSAATLSRKLQWLKSLMAEKQVSRYLGWMHSSVLAYSPEQRLGERWGKEDGGGGWLGSFYLLHWGRNETPRIRRQPVCVIPSGNPTLTGARKKKKKKRKALWKTEQRCGSAWRLEFSTRVL